MNSHFLLSLAAAVSCMLAPQTTMGQKDVTNVKMLGIGATNILDTYLSPEHYTGTEIRFIDHTTRHQTGEVPTAWTTTLVHKAQLSYSSPRSEDANEMMGLYTFSYGRHYNWQFLGGTLRVKAGAQAEAGLGFLYNTRNANNPAQARAYLNIAPGAAVCYRFSIGCMPCAAGYEVAVPLAGVLFSPNYGQSYYEIFSKGDYDHNAVVTTPFSAPSFRQMLSLDLTLRKTTLRIGYLGDCQQAKVNHLKYHTYSHLLILGLVRRFQITRLRP